MSKPLFRGKQLKVRVLRRHFNKSLQEVGTDDLMIAFSSIFSCPVAQALKEKFPKDFHSVGAFNLTLKGGRCYNMTNSGHETVKKNKPFTITLTKPEYEV
jgi:hypothetical protein